MRFFPPAQWLAGYRAPWLRGDIVAGVTLAAYAIPVSLAYAGLAGLPPQVGIYGYLLGGLGYALLGSSRQLAIGPTSAISLMIAGTVGEMAGGDAQHYAQIASLAGFTVAALCLIAWLLRLSVLVKLISDSILVGFKAGAGLTIAMTQLPSLFGVAGGGHNFFERVVVLVGQLGQIHSVVLAIGVAAIMLLIFGERVLPGRPVALGVVALSIVAASVLGLPALGVPITGHIPAGLPSLEGPALRLRDVEGIVPLAAGCLLLSYIESVSAGRTFAAKHGYNLDPGQELLGIGVANLAAALGHGYPVAGGLSQSAVNDKAGAHAPRPGLRLDHFGAVPALPHGLPGKPAEGGPGCSGAHRDIRPFGFSGAPSHVASEPGGFLRCSDRTCRGAPSRHPEWHPPRGSGFHADVACPRIAATRGVSWPHSRHQQLLGPRPSSQQ
jgi:MFS superfamily sulfate permease-like transporter